MSEPIDLNVIKNDNGTYKASVSTDHDTIEEAHMWGESVIQNMSSDAHTLDLPDEQPKDDTLPIQDENEPQEALETPEAPEEPEKPDSTPEQA